MKLASWSFVLCLLIPTASAVDWDVETDLDRYVNSDDGYFSWELVDSIRYDRYNTTVYILNMTSQKWQDESLVDHPIWWHNMGVAIPDQIDHPESAFMWVGEQSNDWDEPEHENNASVYNIGMANVANAIKTVGGYTLQIPNQRLKFTNHPDPDDGLSEDTLIAWSWRTFLDDSDPPDPTLPLRMPMTKSAKRGLDAIHEFTAQQFGMNITEFMPLGASKRGWTVWSLAAVDKRVKMAIPVVFSLINFPTVMTNHYQMMDGGWTFAFEPYYEVNLTAEIWSNRTKELFLIEDVFNYKERLTMPKLLIVATGDEFFQCTDSHVWWDQMPDPKHILFVENTEHILFPEYPEIFETIISTFSTYLNGKSLPNLTWTRTELPGGSSIEVWADPAPTEWVAMRAETLNNDTRRDFRLFAGYPDVRFHPVIWYNVSEQMEERGDGHYYVEMDNVEDEWVGFYMFGYWPGLEDRRIFLSTEVQVTPNTYPAPLCTQDPDCYGVLV